jgi:hypothetical protein
MNEVEQDGATIAAGESSVTRTSTPEAVEAASVQHHRSSAGINPAFYRGRGVEWVRPTELMARGGSRVAGAGINFQTELRRRTYEATATSARSIAKRARRLPPLTAFGHGGSRRGAERGSIGTP